MFYMSPAVHPSHENKGTMHVKREMEDEKYPITSAISKKRKTASDAERMAVELSKINFCHEIKCSMKLEKTHLSFPESARQFQRSQCTWRGDKAKPCYCEKAELKFETSLPNRNYLTRFSVHCRSCYDEEVSAVHLYCAYCDEVLTGTIAGPGGKVSDHLITIRHVYQQALVLKESLESEEQSPTTLSQARHYIAKFEEWSNKVRYPLKTAVKQIHLEAVLGELRRLLARYCAAPPVRAQSLEPSNALIKNSHFPLEFRPLIARASKAP